ncbi:hypothetical protein CN946_07900 [Bacillus sp. AFS053548]|nr:hypothetical protein CN946_07900 [Bacillus sp. AFS053548]
MHFSKKENITKKYTEFVRIVRKLEVFSVLNRMIFLFLDYFENYNRYQKINLVFLKLNMKMKGY